ncbi:hypothetical protein Tco_1243080 [Tanacetum coccineum]
MEKLTGVEPGSRPKTIKSILKSKSTFKAETLKGMTINEPSSAPARGNKSSSVSKTNSAPAGKLKNVKMKDDPPLAIVMKELNELKLQISKNKSSYFRNKNSQQYHNGQGESSLRYRPERPAIPFPSYIQCGYNDHKSDNCVYYPICEICGSYDHDTHGKEKLFKLRKLSLSKQERLNHQCNIRESLSRLNNYRSKHILPAQIWDLPGPEGMYGNNSIYITEGYGYDFRLNNLKEAFHQQRKICQRSAEKTSSKRKECHLISVENFQDTETLAVLDATWTEKALQMLVSFLKIKNHTLKRDIEFHFIPTQYQLPDIFTKPLDETTFKRLIVELGLLNIDSKPEALVLTEEN